MKMQKYYNYTIFDWDASWPTECRLTSLRFISPDKSILLDVASSRRWNVVT